MPLKQIRIIVHKWSIFLCYPDMCANHSFFFVIQINLDESHCNENDPVIISLQCHIILQNIYIYANMLICCAIHILTFIKVKNSLKFKQHLFEILIFCNIVTFITVTFEQFNAHIYIYIWRVYLQKQITPFFLHFQKSRFFYCYHVFIVLLR